MLYEVITNQRCCNSCCIEFDLQIDLGLTDDDMTVLHNLDENIVIGKVMSLEAHSDPSITKVRVTQTNVGKDRVLQILCGGINRNNFV